LRIVLYQGALRPDKFVLLGLLTQQAWFPHPADPAERRL